jgi:hypothetical protein
MQEKSQDTPINIVKLKPSNLKDYERVKTGSDFKVNDLVHLIDDEYVKISEGNIVLKQKVNQYNTVLRKKK